MVQTEATFLAALKTKHKQIKKALHNFNTNFNNIQQIQY